MARTESTMIAVGTPMPAFALPDPSGRVLDSVSFAGSRGVLVAFLCNHCPFVKHVAAELAAIGMLCDTKRLGMVAINSNDVERYPDDAPPLMARMATESGWTFPYLFDETQAVARAFDAACTPDFFLFGADGALAYRGQLDDSRPGNGIPVTGKDLRAAIEAVAAGKPASEDQRPSVGCNIKWKTGGAGAAG
ncbi:MAG: thioredoxin family protein [Phycisphaerales bacterium]|nr:thioredoxin family protein [Phycisphaerales bacterium]